MDILQLSDRERMLSKTKREDIGYLKGIDSSIPVSDPIDWTLAQQGPISLVDSSIEVVPRLPFRSGH